MDENQVVEQKPAPGGQSGKADLGKRAVAIFIDGVICGIFYPIFNPFIAPLVAAAYLLLRDGFGLPFMNHRSLGKKLMKLRPVRIDGKAVDLTTSSKRNWVLAVPFVVSAIPVFWVLATVLFFAVAVIEILLVVTRDDGRRWGDQMAETHVIEVQD